MIYNSLKYVQLCLNQFFRNKLVLTENSVVINRIISIDGSNPIENNNKVIITLIHVEQEVTRPFSVKNKRLESGKYEKTVVGQYNLFLLVTSNFEDYSESLKFLNTSIEFFQTNDVLDANVNSSIPKGVQKLEFEFQKDGDYKQMHNLWSALGAKYQPSVIYKMKLVNIGGYEVKGFIPSIK